MKSERVGNKKKKYEGKWDVKWRKIESKVEENE